MFEAGLFTLFLANKTVLFQETWLLIRVCWFLQKKAKKYIVHWPSWGSLLKQLIGTYVYQIMSTLVGEPLERNYWSLWSIEQPIAHPVKTILAQRLMMSSYQ